jgi:hypothetical protein
MNRKVADALGAISAGWRVVVATDKHLVNDLAELNIDNEEMGIASCIAEGNTGVQTRKMLCG